MKKHLGKVAVASVVGALLGGVAAVAQQPSGDAAGLPVLKGVYYRSGGNWVTLQHDVLWPYKKNGWKWYAGVGQGDYYAEVPGEHARVQVADGQPVFYVRGMASALGPRLVQYGAKRDFRSLRYNAGRLFEPSVPFHRSVLRDADVTQVAPNIVSIRPRGTLTPGEYAVVATAGPDQQRLYMNFDFRVGGR